MCATTADEAISVAGPRVEAVPPHSCHRRHMSHEPLPLRPMTHGSYSIV